MNIDLLNKVCAAPGASGFEDRIRLLILKELDGLADEVRVDNLGNVIATKWGKDTSKTIMSAAHMDEIGFMVRHIDANGFIRFVPLGGFDAKTLTAQRVIIHGKKDIMGVMGCKPIHVMSPAERTKLPEVSDYFIDTGLSKEKVEELITVGDPITRERELIEMGDCVNVKSLDNRVSVFILLEVLRALAKNGKRPAYNFAAVFTVQEEVGIRGANVSAMQIQPDFGLALDITIACDVPGTPDHDKVTCLGEGTAIKIYDSSTICDARMVKFLKKIATKKNIKWQTEILPSGGTDTAGIQRMTPGGSIAGALSIPTRYVHQVIEMCHKDDIQATIDLAYEAICKMDNYEWDYPQPEITKISAKAQPSKTESIKSAFVKEQPIPMKTKTPGKAKTPDKTSPKTKK